MAFTQSDIDAMKTAIASNVQSVRFADGRRVDYRSVDELTKALALAEAEVGSGSGAPGVTYASYSKD